MKTIKKIIKEIEDFGYIVELKENRYSIKEPFKSSIDGNIKLIEVSYHVSCKNFIDSKELLEEIKTQLILFKDLNCKKKTMCGISNGKKYKVLNINYDNMTALCEGDAWIGWQRCGFEKFIEQD